MGVLTWGPTAQLPSPASSGQSWPGQLLVVVSEGGAWAAKGTERHGF